MTFKSNHLPMQRHLKNKQLARTRNSQNKQGKKLQFGKLGKLGGGFRTSKSIEHFPLSK